MTSSLAAATPESFAVVGRSDFGLIELRNGSPLTAEILPNGALFALRHGSVLINSFLPGPAEDGLFRLVLRWRDQGAPEPGEEGGAGAVGYAPLAGAGLEFTSDGSRSAEWMSRPRAGLECRTRLQLHDSLTAWRWHIQIANRSSATLTMDVLHAQDLGLADENAVRNNEAYTSQYVDLLPLRDERLGWTLLARQNQPASEGRHPWVAFGCSPAAKAYCTDGWQFFGTDHRLTGEPAAVGAPALPSKRLQYEAALAGLQTDALTVAPHTESEVVIVARYVADHPAASGATDLAVLHAAIAGFTAPGRESASQSTSPAAKDRDDPVPSVFIAAPWVHGDEPTAADLARWFPEPHRHVERDGNDRVLSFFCGESTHVATRAKEALVLRPHGHVLRSGDATWIDAAQFGVTAYAAGIFSAQSYLGNPNLGRLLSVVRNALGVTRASGQRVFVRAGGTWRQLGVPSTFAMTPGDIRWIYRLGADVLEARTWCSARLPAAYLRLRVLSGHAREFLITHQLALGGNEFDHGGTLRLHPGEAWAGCAPAPDSFTARHLPGMVFAIAAGTASDGMSLGGDELIHADGVRRRGPYVGLQTGLVTDCAAIQAGSDGGPVTLAGMVNAARMELAQCAAAATPPRLPLTLSHPGAELARVAEVLPWFNHNAAIHFSAPHGLEQYGGAAWGVRDVCQGSIEWLLASGRHEIARRVLATVFAQQYFDESVGGLTGTWPQWFMFRPFEFIQQAHSHGDVCFWPVKALCDYAEAADDLAIFDTPIAYTHPRTFASTHAEETLWAHCDRVVAHAESRFIPGTALVNYGDGDWDDTLQPADPAMRGRMVSAWTVALSYQTFRQLAEAARRAGVRTRAERLETLLGRMHADFSHHLLLDGSVAGFLVTEDGPPPAMRPLLHPRDQVTGIHHRLLPMTRSMLAELFSPDQARQHLELIERELCYPDGVRLMSEPAKYHGGLETLFKRADTAANVGREIGLQYVHAHLRYAEAMAKLGEADRLWTALQVVNPVGLVQVVPQAASRQANVYFSSSDADFADRYEAAERWSELRDGRVAVRGGWRLYSSGPGLFLHKVRACLLGLRESFGNIVFDPVLPRSLDGLVAETTLCGRPVRITYRVATRCCGPTRVTVNGTVVSGEQREANPYRLGGLQVTRSELGRHLTEAMNRLEVEL